MVSKKITVGFFSAEEVIEKASGSVPSTMVLGQELHDLQSAAVRQCGFVVSEKAQLWIRRDVFFRVEALRLFVKVAQEKQAPFQWRASGEHGSLIRDLVRNDTLPLMVWFPTATSFVEYEFPQEEITIKERVFTFSVPKDEFQCETISIGISDAMVVPTEHWLQYLWANLIGLGPQLWKEIVGRNPFTFAYRVFCSICRVRSLRPQTFLSSTLKTGKGCSIHPSATVEGSVLGNNVKIGANAVVRGSILSDGAVVEALALCEFSVLGKGAKVQRQAMVKFSVMQKNARVGGVVQLSVLGESAVLKRGSYLMDMNFTPHGVSVLYNNQPMKAPFGVVGGFVGSQTKIGLGVQVAAGRYIPSNLTIVANPTSILKRVVHSQSGMYFIDDGELKRT